MIHSDTNILKQSEYDKIINTISNTYIKPNVFLSNEPIKREFKNADVIECNYFKLLYIDYEVNNSIYTLKFPKLPEENIYMNNKYVMKSILIILENELLNSVFYYKIKNKIIKIPFKYSLYISNPYEFYKTINERPYITVTNFTKKHEVNKQTLHTFSAKTKTYNPIKMLVFYSFKDKIIFNDDNKIYNVVEKNNEFYYINLEKDLHRRQLIEEQYLYINPQRIPAIKNNIGYLGLLYTNYYLLNSFIKKNIIDTCPVILEDDIKLINKNNIFLERWSKYKKYLIKNWGKWNYFSGGCIYIEPIKIINKDPCIVECKYGLCTQFIVHSNKSANKVINYVNKNVINMGIDRLLSDGTDTFWVPYPFLCIQQSTDSNICMRMKQSDYLNIIKNEFTNSQDILKQFVNKNTNNDIVKNAPELNTPRSLILNNKNNRKHFNMF